MPGTYRGSIDLLRKDLVIRAADTNDPAVTTTRILDDANVPAIIMSGNSRIQGLSLVGGCPGVRCEGATAMIRHCRIVQSTGDGIQVSPDTHLEIAHSIVAANKACGINLLPKDGRAIIYGSVYTVYRQ